MKISPEEARANIVAAYTKQHEEAVGALSSAIERVKGTKTTVVKEDTKAEAVSDSKPSLASLLLAVREE
jgi:predicted transcriptional regulator